MLDSRPDTRHSSWRCCFGSLSCLNRSRSDTSPAELTADADDERLTLSFPEAWLVRAPTHPRGPGARSHLSQTGGYTVTLYGACCRDELRSQVR